MTSWRHVTKDRLKSLKPCKDRWENYLKHYNSFSGDIEEFLVLENISAEDKVWVACRILPRVLVEIFAIDCAFATASTAVNYASAANAYADVAAVANASYASDYYAAREDQVDALLMIIEGEK